MLTVSGRFSATCVTAVSCERGEGVAETSRQLRNLLPPFHTFSIIAMFFAVMAEERWKSGATARDRARRSWRPAVAHHEAGHAVMARFLGHDVHFATIRPDPSRNSLGHTRTSASARAIAATKRADGKQHGRLLGRTCSRLCTSVGPALSPSWRLTGRWNQGGARHDLRLLAGLSTKLCDLAWRRSRGGRRRLTAVGHGPARETVGRSMGNARWPQDCSPFGTMTGPDIDRLKPHPELGLLD